MLAPLIFVPNYLMPMLPPPSAITWTLGTYWRAHRTLGLKVCSRSNPAPAGPRRLNVVRLADASVCGVLSCTKCRRLAS